MRDAGAPTVAYAELANAHHAFDILSTVRSRLAANAVADFLGIVYGRRSQLADRFVAALGAVGQLKRRSTACHNLCVRQPVHPPVATESCLSPARQPD